MRFETARRLQKGDRLEIFPATQMACEGTVTERLPGQIRVQWDDGNTGLLNLELGMAQVVFAGLTKITRRRA